MKMKALRLAALVSTALLLSGGCGWDSWGGWAAAAAGVVVVGGLALLGLGT